MKRYLTAFVVSALLIGCIGIIFAQAADEEEFVAPSFAVLVASFVAPWVVGLIRKVIAVDKVFAVVVAWIVCWILSAIVVLVEKRDVAAITSGSAYIFLLATFFYRAFKVDEILEEKTE